LFWIHAGGLRTAENFQVFSCIMELVPKHN